MSSTPQDQVRSSISRFVDRYLDEIEEMLESGELDYDDLFQKWIDFSAAEYKFEWEIDAEVESRGL